MDHDIADSLEQIRTQGFAFQLASSGERWRLTLMEPTGSHTETFRGTLAEVVTAGLKYAQR